MMMCADVASPFYIIPETLRNEMLSTFFLVEMCGFCVKSALPKIILSRLPVKRGEMNWEAGLDT